MLNFEIYNNPVFKKILSTIYDIQEVDIFDDPQLNSLCPFFISNKWLKKKLIFNLPFNFYYSPNYNDKEQKVFSEINLYSKLNNVNIVLKSLYVYSYQKRIKAANDPILLLKSNYALIYNKYSKNLKSNIKRNRNKAERNNVNLFISNDRKDLINFYRNVLSKEYIDKHKMVFQPLSLFIELFDANLAILIVAKKEEKCLGGIILIKDQVFLHYNWGASLFFNNIAIGTLLIDKAIQYATGSGFNYFDFGSTPLTDENLYNFKMRWGCRNYPVYYYYTLSKPRVIDLNSSCLWARNIYSKLPKKFIRLMMAKVIPWLVS